MKFCRTLSIREQLLMWLFAAVALATHLQAGKVALQWGQSPDPGVVGYRLRVVQTGTGATTIVEAGNTNAATVDNLLEGQNYSIAVTAYTGSGIESDPSNLVNYMVPVIFSGPTFALQFTNFTHATAQYSPHGTMTPVGEAYPEGTVVTLSATPDSGYLCTAWMVNGLPQSNPTTVTMNQNTSVRPVIKKKNGGGGSTAADPSQTTVRVTALSGGAMTISVGPEMGAWILESTANFRDWTQTATGLTSDQISIPAGRQNSYFRLRQAQLSAFP